MDPTETARAPRTPRLQRGGASFAAVIPQNEQALEFYRRNDFAETGEIQEGEIVMERQL